jgi:hypothetical protein
MRALALAVIFSVTSMSASAETLRTTSNRLYADVRGHEWGTCMETCANSYNDCLKGAIKTACIQQNDACKKNCEDQYNR